MNRKYSLIIEGDDAGYSGYVPELPSILVTGKSIEELTACAKEAVRLYWETLQTDRPPISRNNLRAIRDDIKDYVDMFINAYLSVNPKK